MSNDFIAGILVGALSTMDNRYSDYKNSYDMEKEESEMRIYQVG